MPSTPVGERLAEATFADLNSIPSIDYYEQRYPRRELPAGAMVTRFAPSPTGFMHIGGIYASLINKKVAEQSGGVFFLRVEDTDTRRFIEGAIETVVSGLERFHLPPDEGVVGMKDGAPEEKGSYG